MPRDEAHTEMPRFLLPEGQTAAVRWMVVAAFALVTVLSVWRVMHSLHHPDTQSGMEHQGLVDFHNVVYYPVVAYRDRISPYSPEYARTYPVNRQYPLYSPAMFLLHYPLAFLPLEVGNIVYYLASFGLVIALAASALAVCGVPRTLTNVLGLSTLILVSRPGHINLLIGQVTLPMVLGGLWAMHLARRRPWLAGLALAITTLKPTFGVAIVWLMFCRRDFRATFIAVAVGGALAIAGIAPLVARDGVDSVVQSLHQSVSMHEADPVVVPETSWTRIDTPSVVAKFVPSELGPPVEFAITAACLLIAGWALWQSSRGPRGEGADGLSALIIGTATLACVYHSTYDALLLVAPWVAVLVGRLREQLPGALRPVVWLLLTIPAINYLSARTFTRLLSIEGPLWTALTALNSLCIVAALLLAIVVAIRAPGHRAFGSPLQSGVG